MDSDWEFSPPPTPEAAVDPGEDAARSAAAQGTLGFGDIVSLPGFVGQGMQSGVKWLARKGMEGANALGADIPVDQVMADVERGQIEALSPEERKAVQEGRAIPSAEMGTLPTPVGVETSIKEALPYTQYESKTSVGRLVGTGSRFAAGSALGPLETLPIRLGESALAGVTSEAAGDYATKNLPEYETYFRFAGALAGPAGARGIAKGMKPFVMPNSFADDTAMRLLAEDIRMGKSAMNLQQIADAINNGATPSIIDMAGPKTRAWIAQRYNVSNEMMDATRQLNEGLVTRARETTGNLRDYLTEVFPGLETMSLEDQMKAAQEVERKAIYDLSRTHPNSQNMWNATLQSLSNNGYISDAMKALNKDFLQNRIPSHWNINPPVGGMPPNLQYWDEIKKRLDDVINSSKPNKLTNTGNQATYDAAKEAKNALVAELDRMVPSYGAARNSHAELLGYMSAPEVGAALSKAKSTKDIRELVRAYNGYNGDQQELVRRGLARALYDDLGGPSGNPSSFIKRMTSDNAQNVYPAILGQAEYETMLGRAAAENVMSQARTINELGGRTAQFAAKEGAKAGALLAAGQAASYLTHGELSASSPAAVASIAATLMAVGKDFALNYAERRVAPQVVTLMRSSDPNDIRRLGRMIASNPDAGSFVSKLSGAFSRMPMAALQSQQTSSLNQPSQWEFTPAPENYDAIPGQSSGGRIARKSGGRISGNPISAEVKRVRALLAEKTASMLSVPDDAIATALHIAKRS